MLTGPAEDEFFGVMIQVALVERRRIHGVEKLADVAEAQLDQAGAGGGFEDRVEDGVWAGSSGCPDRSCRRAAAVGAKVRKDSRLDVTASIDIHLRELGLTSVAPAFVTRTTAAAWSSGTRTTHMAR